MEVLGVAFSIMGALKLTVNLFSTGWKMYKKCKKGPKAWEIKNANIAADDEDDVDDEVTVTNAEMMATGATLVLQLESVSEPRRQSWSKPAEQVGQETKRAGGLKGERHAVSDGSRVLNETQMETLTRFRPESERQYNALSSKLSDTNQDALGISRKYASIQESEKQLQDSPLDLAIWCISEFKASEGEKLDHLKTAFYCAMTALATTNHSSLKTVFSAGIIAISTSYTLKAKKWSAKKARDRVVEKVFKTIEDKLKPYWNTEFANITMKGLKAVEILMDIASSISLLPPANVIIPSLDDRLVQVFGCFCVWKPEMLQRYPKLGIAALRVYRSRTSDNFEREAIKSLSNPTTCRRTSQSWYILHLENQIGLLKDNHEFYHYAEQGLLSKLKTLYAKDKAFPKDETMCSHAAKGGHRDVLEWLHKKGCSFGSKTFAAAAYGGHLEVLKWAVDKKGCQGGKTICSAAALGGHLDVLRWAYYKKHMPLDKLVCSNAAFNGHMKVLTWARSKKCPWDEYVCSLAAFGGHLKILQWARENGCKWDQKTCSYAVKGGHLEILKWARENGCPWDKKTLTDADEEVFQDIVD